MVEPFDKDIYYKNGEYIIKEIVCDYEIIDLRNNKEPKMILNCFNNAKLICDILKSDDLHEYFKFEQKPIEIAQMEHLQKELTLYKKALELAVDELDWCAVCQEKICPYLNTKSCCAENCKNGIIQGFLQQAKEKQNENRNKI